MVAGGGGGVAHLEVLEAVGGEGEGELVAAALVLEAVEAAEGLGDGDVEDEVAKGEEADGGPAVPALEPLRRGTQLGSKYQGQEEEEELEEAPQLLLLRVHRPLLLQRLLEVQLDDRVQRLHRRLHLAATTAIRRLRHHPSFLSDHDEVEKKKIGILLPPPSLLG